MTTTNPLTCRRDSIVIQQSQKELLIYDLKSNQAFCLNETSAITYQLCDGTKTVTEISKILSEQLKTIVSEDYVWLAVSQFHKNNLLEKNSQFDPLLKNINRRQLVKKIGLASMAALPLVSVVFVPTAAQAASSPLNAGCNPNNTCNGAAVSGSLCTCPSISCPPGFIVNVAVTVGACVTATVAANAGVPLSANTNGLVCLYTAVCI